MKTKTFKFEWKDESLRKELQNNQHVCDVLFVGSDYAVSCHSLVLRDISPAFSDMFSGKFKESMSEKNCTEIEVDLDIKRSVIATAVDYFYTGVTA